MQFVFAGQYHKNRIIHDFELELQISGFSLIQKRFKRSPIFFQRTYDGSCGGLVWKAKV